jgi:iron(III) transport system ATP-binding protein
VLGTLAVMTDAPPHDDARRPGGAVAGAAPHDAGPRGEAGVVPVDAAEVAVRGISKSFGGPPVLRDVDLRVGAGRIVALLGPSGCGKTTLLRIIGGLERPDHGTVTVGSRVLVGEGRPVPPEKRRIGMVFQDWALFPHLSVARNVAYGLPRDGDRPGRVDEALAMVGLAGLGERMPGTLSGGQQQRVALARALAPRPSVLLLDEPFSNLDTALRVQVRSEVHELLARLGITTVLVTHDQEEAFVLGDEVAVMSEGCIVQQATPAVLYRRPASTWVADFVGDANLVPAEARGRAATSCLGEVELAEPAQGPVEVLVRPEDLEVFDGVVDDQAAEVELVEFYGHDTVYVVRLADGFRLRARESSAPEFARGDLVSVRYAGAPPLAYRDGQPVAAPT